MYVIHINDDSGFEPRLMAAFVLTDDGEIKFDLTRSDTEFVADLHEVGVRLLTEQGIVYVKPQQGTAFRDACLEAYCGVIACNDEDELSKLSARYPSPPKPRHSNMPPANAA